MDITKLIDAGTVGGWARAGVAAGISIAIAKWPWLSTFLSPEIQGALSVIVAGAVVGLWSQLVKTDNAKIEAVEEIPEVKKIVVSSSAPTESAAAQAASDVTRPKVVTQ